MPFLPVEEPSIVRPVSLLDPLSLHDFVKSYEVSFCVLLGSGLSRKK